MSTFKIGLDGLIKLAKGEGILVSDGIHATSTDVRLDPQARELLQEWLPKEECKICGFVTCVCNMGKPKEIDIVKDLTEEEVDRHEGDSSRMDYKVKADKPNEEVQKMLKGMFAICDQHVKMNEAINAYIANLRSQCL